MYIFRHIRLVTIFASKLPDELLSNTFRHVIYTESIYSLHTAMQINTFYCIFWTALGISDQFGVSNVQKGPKLTEKINIFILLVVHLVTAKSVWRNFCQVTKPFQVHSITSMELYLCWLPRIYLYLGKSTGFQFLIRPHADPARLAWWIARSFRGMGVKNQELHRRFTAWCIDT